MGATFQCPSCLGTLEYEDGNSAFQICRHCKGKILVPSEAVHKAEIEEAGPSDFSLGKEKDFLIAEIQRELQEGRKIQAITMYRKYFGGDLGTAKAAVEALEDGSTLDVSRSALERGYAVMRKQPPGTIYSQPPSDKVKQSRRSALILGILIALGIALLNFFFRN